MCSGSWSGFYDPVMGEHRMVRVTRQRKQERPEAKAALTFGECSQDPSAHGRQEEAGGGQRGAPLRAPQQRCPALSSGNLQKGVRCEACLESSRQVWGAVAGR